EWRSVRLGCGLGNLTVAASSTSCVIRSGARECAPISHVITPNVYSHDEEHKPMQRQTQDLTSLLRSLVSSAALTVLIALATLSLSAQNSVPATAVEAARMPQFASRLAPSATPGIPRRHSPQPNGAAYDNGPVNGQVDAWTLNFGLVTT